MSTGYGSLGVAPLGGATTGSARATASLTLSASGAGIATTTATAALSLAASGSVAAAISGSAALDLSATGALNDLASGTASMSLSAAGTVNASTSGSGSLSLSASGSTTSPASGSGSLSLSATGSANSGVVTASASLSLSASGAAKAAITATASLALSASGSAKARGTGTASLSLSATGTAVALTISDLTSTAPSRGAEVVSETTGDTEFELSVEVLDKIIERPPSALTVVVAGGEPEQDVTFSLEPAGGGSVDVYTTSLDSDGSLGPTSLGITVAVGGDVGVRTVTATQGSLNGADTYTVLRAASLGEVVQGPDASPIELSEAVVGGVRKWVFQDLLPAPNGGIGSYVFEINPTQMSSPQREHQLTSRHSTAMDGNYHVFQAGNAPLEWTFSGFCPSEDMYEKLYVYSNLNRRFYIIDHHNRAWKSVITHLEIIPRLRTNYNGVESDWIQDYTVTAIIIDQDPVTPV